MITDHWEDKANDVKGEGRISSGGHKVDERADAIERGGDRRREQELDGEDEVHLPDEGPSEPGVLDHAGVQRSTAGLQVLVPVLPLLRSRAGDLAVPILPLLRLLAGVLAADRSLHCDGDFLQRLQRLWRGESLRAERRGSRGSSLGFYKKAPEK